MKQMQQDAKVVDGYCFLGEDDAELARQEEKKIMYMDRHMDYSVPEKVLMLYTRSIDERIFKTPIGYDYLRKMQDFLLNSPEINPEDVPPIKLFVNFKPTMRSRTNPARERVQPPAEKKKVNKFALSVLLNFTLAIAVAVMFYIAVKSDNPNIINYENAVVNKYAAWEEELTQREQIVREKERELNLQNE
ncbi:MAG: hypothetical protein IJ282_09025 [Lachnospiraceae bacterium]|nr:hypothetical protein [Lachnospiraceae bacterium]